MTRFFMEQPVAPTFPINGFDYWCPQIHSTPTLTLYAETRIIPFMFHPNLITDKFIAKVVRLLQSPSIINICLVINKLDLCS